MSALKMMAMDEEDLTVLSAYCQDAVFKAADVTWLAAEKRVLISLNRFAWEQANQRSGVSGLLGRKTYERHNAVLHFEQVTKVQTKGLDEAARDTVFDLLSMEFVAGEDDVSGQIELLLAEGHSIRLDVKCVEVRLADLDAAWETRNRPRHPLS
uniref:DUF2948 family protein n=1 Tax=Pararhizobium sp. IMCC3301 TaxID=3067904 RepID=UPI002742383D|nr:DUF2948 family protein [Pararhizobium sp. IMCC3301]